MGKRLADVTLGDLWRAVLRYRPVVVAVAVVLVALQVLPDRSGGGGRSVVPIARDRSGSSTAGGPRVAGDAGDDSSSAGDGEFTDDTGDGGSGADELASGDGVGFDDSSFDDGSSFDEGDDSSFDDGSLDDEGGGGDAGDGGSGDDFSFGDDQGGPLFVVAYGWATATAGTPLASSEVPEDTMPVGKRVGQDDKRSFFRLDGGSGGGGAGDAVLQLVEHEGEGQRTPPVGTVGVRLCQSVDAGWDEGGGQTFDEAPRYDANHCVDGTRTDDGTWSFDLSSFASATDERGFVLLPAADSAVDFQVAFDPA